MGNQKTPFGRQTHWLAVHRGVTPSLLALFFGATFWALGATGGISYLHDASFPTAVLGGLYVVLAAIALSIIITTAAASYLVQPFAKEGTGPR
ncbi:hypothetical protein [Arthrobacter flavus]|uniref:Uncharacterized protein n=1 Tax=Arthrobacter flavus TaxID=95172 RepID=A0ABW4Q3H9_9MICC